MTKEIKSKQSQEWRIGDNVPPLDVARAFRIARRTIDLINMRLQDLREAQNKGK